MPLDVTAITTGLVQDATHIDGELGGRGGEGLWRSAAKANLSYPDAARDVFSRVEADSYWFRHRNACLAALLARFRPAGTLLDVGGGNGFVCRGLIDAGFDAALLEPGVVGAMNALDCGVSQVLCATLEEANFRDGSLPAAGLFDVLERLEDDRALLAELHRVLAAEGLLVVTVPSGQRLWSADDEYAGHYRRYGLAELESILETAGFEVLYTSHLFSFLVAPVFLFKSLPTKWGAQSRNEDLEAVKRDHDAGGGLVGGVVSRLLDVERKRIERGKRIPFGTSCIIVARRRIGGAT